MFTIAANAATNCSLKETTPAFKITAEVVLLKFKAIFRRMTAMCPEAWYIFIRSIQLCCFLLLCATAILLHWDGSMQEGYELYMTAKALNETSQALLLIAVLFSVLIEDRQG